MDKVNKTHFSAGYNIYMSGSKNGTLPEQAENNNAAHAESREYMSPAISSAQRAYGLSFVNKNKTIPQKSLKEMIKWLEAQGKVEGKDFKLGTSVPLGNTYLILKNKQGKDELSINYSTNDYSKWDSYYVVEYGNGNIAKEIHRDKNGDITQTCLLLDNNDIRVKDDIFVKNWGITPEEYIQNLKENEINYRIENYHTQDENTTKITILGENGNKTTEVRFNYKGNTPDEYISIGVSEYDKTGKERKYINFCKDTTSISNYFN